MADNKVIKPVGFNAIKDKSLLDHVKRRNFSGYVKSLIAADMIAKGKIVSEPIPEEIKPLTTADKLAMLKEKTSNKAAR